MRVLRIADVAASKKGGAGGFMLSSSEALVAQGHEVQHVFGDRLAGSGMPPQIRRFVVPLTTVWYARRARIAGQRPEVVEIREPSAALYCMMRRHFPRMQLPPVAVLSFGLEDRGWRATLDRAERRGRRVSLKSRLSVGLTVLPQTRYATRNADQVLVSSTEDADHLTDVLNVEADRVMRINSGVSEAYFRLGRPDRGAVERVVFVGSWIDRKGAPELVAAWSDLHRHHPGVRLTVACTSLPEEKVLADFPPQVRETVDVMPVVDEPELMALLADGDVFVLPSWFEGMPLSLLQAAGAGLPCVVGAVCGNLDFVRPQCADDDGGILVPPHSGSALADALKALVSDPARARRMGERARERARLFTWAHTAEQAVAGYRAALARQ